MKYFDGDYSGFPNIDFDKYSDSIGNRACSFLPEGGFRSEFREYCVKLATELLPPEVYDRGITEDL